MPPQGLADILTLNGTDLDALYRSAAIGNPPTGKTSGALLLFPGTPVSPILRPLGRLVWQGKLFNHDSTKLLNYVSIFRFKTVPANVYPGESWFDGQPSTILDYSKTSFVAKLFRDEIREIAPGVYLGQAFVARRRWFRFLLHSTVHRE